MKKLFALLFISLSLVGCQPAVFQEPVAELPRENVTLVAPSGEELIVDAEVGDVDSERTKGLMFRKELPEGKGMLFVFPVESVLTFWMKNTVIPLDILFFNGNGEFVSMQHMVPCETDPCTTYSSNEPAMFALEVPAGYAIEHDIGEGWKLLRNNNQP